MLEARNINPRSVKPETKTRAESRLLDNGNVGLTVNEIMKLYRASKNSWRRVARQFGVKLNRLREWVNAHQAEFVSLGFTGELAKLLKPSGAKTKKPRPLSKVAKAMQNFVGRFNSEEFARVAFRQLLMQTGSDRALSQQLATEPYNYSLSPFDIGQWRKKWNIAPVGKGHKSGATNKSAGPTGLAQTNQPGPSQWGLSSEQYQKFMELCNQRNVQPMQLLVDLETEKDTDLLQVAQYLFEQGVLTANDPIQYLRLHRAIQKS
jgi:hypothetical protein